jgi:hypothetical protein
LDTEGIVVTNKKFAENKKKRLAKLAPPILEINTGNDESEVEDLNLDNDIDLDSEVEDELAAPSKKIKGIALIPEL